MAPSSPPGARVDAAITGRPEPTAMGGPGPPRGEPWASGVATDAVQLFGGSSYPRETGIERFMRDAKGAQIYEGMNQIRRLIVADEVLDRARG